MHPGRSLCGTIFRKAATFLPLKFWIGLGVFALIAFCFIWEIQTSKIQAYYFAKQAPDMITTLGPGPSPLVISSPGGPYDRRLGYSRLKAFSKELEENQFNISRQARPPIRLLDLVEKGLFPMYPEKTQAGLTIRDRHGNIVYSQVYPKRVFATFSEIPPIVVNLLLFIENRELLDPNRPFANPAVDWVRLSNAVLQMAKQFFDSEQPVEGGSTLATQLEKLRHSDDGITLTAKEKLIQMLSASLRAYMNGRNTLEARRHIVLDYINSTPLAARANYGEIFGLGDGLWAWYGRELRDVVNILNTPESDNDIALKREKAVSLKQVLSLFLAHKKPSVYLLKDRRALMEKCDRYINLLAREGIISKALQKAMLKAPLTFRRDLPASNADDSVDGKLADSIRTRLLSLLDIDQLYTVDRFDMSVKSTIDLTTQVAITQEIMRLKDPDWISEKHLRGLRTLDQGDPGQVIYSFSLYEKTPAGNLLRIQTDTYDQPFNVNRGLKLNLGSTAKLRTLIHYMEIIASLHEEYNRLTPDDLHRIKMAPEDKLRRWACSYLLKSDEKALVPMLRAAMDRIYSASPSEVFFTGGGLHHFENFNKKDNYRKMSIREGFRRSVNLVFIRLMRDIVHYHMFGTPLASQVIADQNHPQRKEYLKKFADFEGTEYLKKFYTAYGNDSPKQIWKRLISSVRPIPRHLAAVYRYIFSEDDFAAFRKFLLNQFPDYDWRESDIIKLYQEYAPDRLSLSNRSHIAGIHPLELWLAAYLYKHPSGSLEDVLKESDDIRQDAYRWLFQTSIKRKQDRRIRVMLEQEAFLAIHKAWRELGYPFDHLVASYATAIGSSADRPQALAELMGIIANDGVYRPSYCIQEIKFAVNTPYEVHFTRLPPKGKRVLKTAVAQIVKEALFNVVAKGTGKSVSGAFLRPDDTPIPIGGKTGTGDDQYKTYDSNGKLISAKTINRSATFAFIIGDRFFGNITAYVPGSSAADYTFTSSLPLAILKIASKRLMPLLTSEASSFSSL